MSPDSETVIDTLIVHQFAASPFSEKIRAVLGYKTLAWRAVDVPRILPKPDLMPLTGGYRRTPVLQIGRDIYCDTSLIVPTLERIAPRPPVLPAALAASIDALEQLGDRVLFLAAIPVLFSPAGRAALGAALGEDYLKRFRRDRAALFADGTTRAPDAQFSRANWAPCLRRLDVQLAAADYLLGDTPTLADFAVYAPIWYVRGNAGVGPSLDAYPHLMAWYRRVHAFGHGAREPMAAEAALTAAADCERWQPLAAAAEDESPAPGARVSVRAIDYGTEAVVGELVHAAPESWTLARRDPRVGPLRVHFPRRGFRLDLLDDTSRASNHGAPY